MANSCADFAGRLPVPEHRGRRGYALIFPRCHGTVAQSRKRPAFRTSLCPQLAAQMKKPERPTPAVPRGPTSGLDHTFFEQFLVAKPQIRNIRRAEAQDILERAAHFPQPEV